MKFKIDLHVHSWASGDNDSDPEESVRLAIGKGLDGIAFTEHYSYGASEHAESLREKYGSKILILRGVEFSCLDGHCLVFGVDTDRLKLKDAPFSEIAVVINRAGGVVIPSHPYRGGNSLGDVMKTVSGICAVEGYNGCNMHIFNVRAIDAARQMGIPFTGGSDAHLPNEVGSCYTEFDDKITNDNLVQLLRDGKYKGVDIRKISRKWIF